MTDAKTLTGRVNTQRSRGTYGWRQSVAVTVAVGAMWNDRTARRGQSLKEGQGLDVMVQMGLDSVEGVGWASDTGEDQGGVMPLFSQRCGQKGNQ